MAIARNIQSQARIQSAILRVFRRNNRLRRLPRWSRPAALARLIVCGLVLTLITIAQGLAADTEEPVAEQPKDTAKSDEKPDEKREKESDRKWQPLFDGKSLKGWNVTDFAGHGEAVAENGQLILRFGDLLTGVTWDNELFEFPTSMYEISLEAQRVDGSDFFCGLTFPVGKEHCSLIVGGWGGGLVGLSCIDGADASENATTAFEKFENKKWYPIRVRVTDAKIQAWIEDRTIVEVERGEKEFSVRWEVEDSRPLGIATYQSTAAIKEFKFRKLEEKDLRDGAGNK